MSFVGKPYRHDVFVSYSHGDVLGEGESLLKQWSQSFVRELEGELRTFPELGAQVSVFLDENHRPGKGVDPMAPLSEQLKQEVAGSAILAILMTPHYLASNWCRQELEWWIEAQRAKQLDHQDRVAIARVWPTGDAPWHEALLDRARNPYVGQWFFDRARQLTHPQPYAWPEVAKGEKGDFRAALLDLVGNIQYRLREVRKQLELRRKRDEELVRLKGTGQAIFLYGRESQQHAWQRVRHELVESGYGVFPFQPEPVDSEPKKIRDRASKRVDRMQTCDAILLLGTEDSEALEGDLSLIGHSDRHLAKDKSNRLLPCSVVDAAGVLGKDPILKRIAANLRVDWIDASVSPWTPRVQAWLSEAR